MRQQGATFQETVVFMKSWATVMYNDQQPKFTLGTSMADEFNHTYMLSL
jgi:hypothetical protein